MTVRVLCFGVLRELLGSSAFELEVPEGAAVEEVVRRCQERSMASPVWDCLAVAVNEEYSRRDRRLVDQDTVALLPPVSGG